MESCLLGGGGGETRVKQARTHFYGAKWGPGQFETDLKIIFHDDSRQGVVYTGLNKLLVIRK